MITIVQILKGLKMQVDYLVGVYGFLQLSMQDVGLLNAKGQPIKGKRNMGELDALAIYHWVGDKIKHIDGHTLRKKGAFIDGMVKNLLNKHTVVNNFLLAVLMLREYVDEDGTHTEKILLSAKINRLVDVVDSAVSDEAFDVDIKRTTSRTAKNIYRQFKGRGQLSDEYMDNRFRRK